ncbi:tetratricopeptide (TPR) repeat protein [Spinactinospora alkalitolerans]|uniref:Tetratricopeptide (TPR) repeat protein n=1 Tax=Spinactinospora alkalitolerans TaxID=687207 RepID=A0A852TTF2_9ACTN|nr:tetratricopeptide repeat protein [Spinactinospora alkalitolerans]NYE46785.1 tetratricopeptide (TPR) repeat protein [Spinactinospora alkalitolerans]
MSVWRSLLRASRLTGARSAHREPAAPAVQGTPGRRAAKLEQTLREYVETLGADHSRSIAARNNLASQYAQMGRREAAIGQFEEALADSVSALGEEHPQTDVIRENLAWSYEDAARFTEAAAQWEILLQQRRQRLGSAVAETVTARTRLAFCYRRTGQFDAAIVHFERALEDSTGAVSDELEGLRIGLALAFLATDRFDDAAQQFRMVLAQRHRRLGSRHYETLVVQHRLGRTYLQAGRDAEAVETLRSAYRNCLAAAGDHEIRLLTMKVRRELAGAYRSVGRPRDAAALY